VERSARKDFRRVQDNNWVGGVCGGIAYAFGISAILVRVVALVLVLLSVPYAAGVVFWGYIIAWACCPIWDEDPADYLERTT